MFNKLIQKSKSSSNDKEKEFFLDKAYLSANTAKDFSLLLAQYLELKIKLYPIKPNAFFGVHYDHLMQKIYRIASLVETYSRIPSMNKPTYAC